MRRSIAPLVVLVTALASCATDVAPPARPETTAQPALGQGRSCGTHTPSESRLQATEREVDRRLGVSNATSRFRRAPSGAVTIPVWFHVITRADGTGDVTRRLRAQIDVLNAAYSGAESGAAADTGFRFAEMGRDVTASDAWFDGCASTGTEHEMKTALYYSTPPEAQSAGVLHLYTCEGGGLLGYAYLPDGAAGEYYDGVVVAADSLPGGAYEFASDGEPDGVLHYNRGDTATHEVGHWLGLLHTFDGGCSKRGDGVADTPSEKSANFYCVVADTCRRDPGDDPVHNYMDYTDDPCMTEFTAGQTTRMQAMWTAFRQ